MKMNELRLGGGKNDTSKKFYKSPELRVIDLESSDIICTSPSTAEYGLWDEEEDI